MSLVGSLEDLGLADILQIVSLSRKSGLLVLRSEDEEGRIVFRDGQVRAARVRGEPDDLCGIVSAEGLADAPWLRCVAEAAAQAGRDAASAVAEATGLSAEKLDALRREHAERAVLRMFGWRQGEFSFEVRDQVDPRDAALLLESGINAQYLTMEATRLGDEGEPRGAPGEREEAGPGPERPDAGGADAGIASPAREREASPRPVAASAAPAPAAEPAAPAPLVAIDPDLPALEWLKAALGPLFSRIHIFQRSDGGVSRVRQYLGRAEVPVVLVSAAAPADPLSGARDVGTLVRRLRALSPAMPIFVVRDAGAEALPRVRGADAVLERPPARHCAGEGSTPTLEAAAARLRDELGPWARHCSALSDRSRRGAVSAAGLPDLDVGRLKRMSEQLRDPARRGEVLSLVLDFAAESFSRVAIFMVRDDVAVGLAQRGLERAGGPDDAGIQGLEFPARDSGWFREVLERRASLRSEPGDEGDRRLAARLGGQPPEAYVAPIESGERVVALLYADNLPEGGPLPDTTVLEVALHEAGVALERALLERALAEVDAASRSG